MILALQTNSDPLQFSVQVALAEQLLLCELLAKNQRLRFRRMHDELAPAVSIDETAR